MIMFNLLYFIKSNDEYQKFVNFYADGDIIGGYYYYIFNEDLHSNDGRIFQTHDKILVAVSFISSKLT